jgi:serine/threonine protein phosphatase PrpC
MEETRGYQPPEVVFSEEDIPYDLELPSSYDIWSIGVVFLEILFGNSQVFMIQNPQIKAKIDRQFDISSTKHQKEKEKSYFFYALKEFCIVPTKNEPITFSSSSSTSLHLQKQNTRQVDILLDKYAILSRNEKPTNCHFGQFNQTILLRDPFHHGFIKNNPWGLKLLWGLLQWEPTKRLTAKEALEHAFFKGPYICLTTGLKFATLKEFHLHLDYLKALKETKKKKTKVDTTIELPSDFLCPQCHRVFTTMEGCLQHVHGRKHFNNHTIHFCQYEKNQLTLLVKEQTWRYGHLKKIKKKKKNVVFSSTSTSLYGEALFQGRRSYMEDLLVVFTKASFQERPFQIYAVVDGHLGHTAAHFVQENLLNFMLKAFEKIYPLLSSSSTFKKDPISLWDQFVVHETFTQLNDAFLASLELKEKKTTETKTLKDFSGCTLTVVVYFPIEKRLVSANVGDSRAILLTTESIKDHSPSRLFSHHGFKVDTLSMDHVPQQQEERQRIESSGGFIKKQGLWRVMGQLAVSRSIGDRHLRQYVSSEPSIFHHQIQEVSFSTSKNICPLEKKKQTQTQLQFALLATDGLWEVMSTEQVSTFIWDELFSRIKTVKEKEDNCHISTIITAKVLDDIAQALVVEAYVKGSSDNIAVLLLALQ